MQYLNCHCHSYHHCERKLDYVALHYYAYASMWRRYHIHVYIYEYIPNLLQCHKHHERGMLYTEFYNNRDVLRPLSNNEHPLKPVKSQWLAHRNSNHWQLSISIWIHFKELSAAINCHFDHHSVRATDHDCTYSIDNLLDSATCCLRVHDHYHYHVHFDYNIHLNCDAHLNYNICLDHDDYFINHEYNDFNILIALSNKPHIFRLNHEPIKLNRSDMRYHCYSHHHHQRLHNAKPIRMLQYLFVPHWLIQLLCDHRISTHMSYHHANDLPIAEHFVFRR
ncbi:hypothetical protein EJ04DRAFT_563266 [Polyplosphaeria fusca]|uniref:Uncharacterized protein n=1 Tax=Polyplosphaeria fusca TaxID=682080 RepID=A0A9P4R2E3_9PLEO|nr:hypothetical protein EJ04DRAFT_563266 [Polyplosphaeria fusca]